MQLPTIGMLGAAALLIPAAVRAQPAKSPAFEVAAVKPNIGGDPLTEAVRFLPGGRLSVVNSTLHDIIVSAYNLPFQNGDRLKAGPDWLDKDRFDINATAPASTTANDKTVKERQNTMRAMMRTMLVDRFHLVMRSEMKELSVYAAVVGKKGVKLEKSKLEEEACEEAAAPRDACHHLGGGMGRGIHGEAADITDLVLFVANWSDRPIVDHTGLKGLYKFDTSGWAPVDIQRDGSKVGENGVPWSERPTLFTIFEQMGLKLESARAAVETFTIVGVERPVTN